MIKVSLSILFLFAICTSTASASDICRVYMSVTGDDTADGSASCPVASLERALDIAFQKNSFMTPIPEVHIMLNGGTYHLSQTAIITCNPDNKPYTHLYIEAIEGENPVLSGGTPVVNWQPAAHINGLPHESVGNILEADVTPAQLQYRQMWVNGRRAMLASDLDNMTLNRIICKDADSNGLIVPAIPFNFRQPEKVEVTIIQDWAMNILRVKTITTDGHRSHIKFMEPESTIEFKRPWPILRASENSSTNHFFKLSNAVELLNRPREWYNDAETGKLYYYPTAGETADNTSAIVPRLETIISIEGTLEHPVQNITFKGITFAHTTWLRPSEYGHIPLQAGQFLYDAYSMKTATADNVAWVGRPKAAVSVCNARGITFEDCRFEHTGSTALDFVSGVKNATVRGSVFNDIGGNGIQAGFFGDKTFECHQAWNPIDTRVVCDTILIDNNYIAHPAVDDWGCLAVTIGFASNVTISHNEIFDTPYSAINMGWGWVKDLSIMHDNHIIGNYIHSFSNQMRDSGAIYTLSAQPHSSIEGNRIEKAGNPQLNPVMWDNMTHSQFDIYTDEGTDYYTIKNNWIERGEISKNKNGTHNVWGLNSNSVDTVIKNAAGLSKNYSHLPSTVIHYPTTEE